MTLKTQRLLTIPIIYGLLFMVCCMTTVTAQKSQLERAEDYYKQGKSFFNKGDYKKSIEAYDNAIEIAKTQKDSILLGEAITMKGHVYWLDGEYQKAIDIYYKALEIHKKTNNLRYETATLSGLATVLKRMGQLDKAYEITKNVIKLSETPFFKEKTMSRVAYLTSANEVYLALEEYDSVHYFADKAIKLDKKEANSKKMQIHAYVEKGMAYYYQEAYPKAFEYLLKTKELLDTHEVNREFFPRALAHYFLASCHYKQQEYDKAMTYLLPILEKIDDQDRKKMYVIGCYLLLANCYAEQKSFKEALHWHNEYIRLNTAYEQEKHEVADKIYKKDTQALENNIELLKTKQAKDQRTKTYAYGTAGVLSLALLGFVVVYIKKQRTNKVVFKELMSKIDTITAQKQLETTKKETTKSIVINDTNVAAILTGLDKLEQEQYFLRQDCTLITMAKKVKTNATYLSKVINTHKEKNVSSYINDLRIDVAIHRLHTDTKFRKYTIKAIAQDIGFKNAEVFTKAFHKKAGIYPSYFIKELAKRA